MISRTCTDCVEGHYCYLNTTDYSINICPSGHYCPQATTDDAEFPCPAGTYNNLTGSINDDACLSCPGGEYCAGVGNTYPTGLCDAGWYCSGGTIQAQVPELLI